MYGYAPEVLDYLTQLFSGGGQDAPQAGAPTQLPGANMRAAPRQTAPRPAQKPQARKPSGLLGSSKPEDKPNAPLPPRRPSDLTPQAAPQAPAPQGMEAFLRSQGIGMPQTAPQTPFPRIDRGPQAVTPQGPTWNPNAAAPSQTMTHGQLPPIDIGMKAAMMPDLGQKIRDDMAAEAPYASAVMAALTARSPAAMFGRYMLSGPKGPSGLLSGPESVPQLPAPSGPAGVKGSPVVPEVRPSYWGEYGSSMAAKPPSLDDVPMLNVRQNPNEFYHPGAMDEMSMRMQQGDKNAFRSQMYGPNADRPNYGVAPEGVQSPFAGGGKDSLPLWQTYIRSMNRGQ